MVISITVRSSQKSVEYTRLPPAVYHDVTNLSDDYLSSVQVFMNASIRKYRTLYPSMVQRVITQNVTT